MVPRSARRDKPRRTAIRRARRKRRAVVLLVLLVALVVAIGIFVAPERNRAVAEAPAKGRLLLDENFNGTSLDTSRWSPCYWWSSDGCTNAGNNELEWYVPEQVKVADGTLSLVAQPKTVTGLDGKQFDYVSGLISGLSPDRTLFSFQYGYVESRVWVPKGQGLWPALWMLPTTRKSLPEIDIFETVGEKPRVVDMTTHWLENGKSKQDGVKLGVPDFTSGWHTIGLEWKPSSLTWYVDGVARFRVTRDAAIPHEPMYLLANLAVGGVFTKSPNGSTPFPSALKVDYIKVWGTP